MGIATFLIGVLPTYAQAGWIATVLLVLMRLAQGFALGGERSGPALDATENAPSDKRALYGTFPQLGAPLGFIIGNGLFLIIGALLPSTAGADPSQPSEAFLNWGWRVPVPVLRRNGRDRPVGTADAPRSRRAPPDHDPAHSPGASRPARAASTSGPGAYSTATAAAAPPSSLDHAA
jgi:hypothetical protein